MYLAKPMMFNSSLKQFQTTISSKDGNVKIGFCNGSLCYTFTVVSGVQETIGSARLLAIVMCRSETSILLKILRSTTVQNLCIMDSY